MDKRIKVRCDIIIEGWVNGSGFSYSTCFDSQVIEVEEAELTADSRDWSWWENNDDGNVNVDDLHIIVRYYSTDTYDDDGEPVLLAEWDTWESHIIGKESEE